MPGLVGLGYTASSGALRLDLDGEVVACRAGTVVVLPSNSSSLGGALHQGRLCWGTRRTWADVWQLCLSFWFEARSLLLGFVGVVSIWLVFVNDSLSPLMPLLCLAPGTQPQITEALRGEEHSPWFLTIREVLINQPGLPSSQAT